MSWHGWVLTIDLEQVLLVLLAVAVLVVLVLVVAFTIGGIANGLSWLVRSVKNLRKTP